jgi:hypothetical protein
MLIYKGRLANIFKRGDFQDKTTGEVKLGKYQLEFISQKELIKGEGVETVLERISIPNELYPQYVDKIGKEVEVKVDSLVHGKKVIYYGIK